MGGGKLIDIARNPPAWRNWPETEDLLAALEKAGGHPRFVGGCVRDALLGLHTEDIDIAIDLSPENVMVGLAASKIRALPTGIKHGTVTAVSGARQFEITTLRVDVKSHGRHADVAFTNDWQGDAERRDFTMNALYLDPKGTLHDPVGGLEDLNNSHVRFIGDPAMRIQEDYLRILRYFRFFARFGGAEPDTAALAAILENASGLTRLSRERVRKEFLTLLEVKNPVPALSLMERDGIHAILFDLPLFPETLQKLLEGAKDAEIALRLAALVNGVPAGAEVLINRLGLSRKLSAHLLALCGGEVTAGLAWEARSHLLYALGAHVFSGQTRLLMALSDTEGDFAAYLEQAEKWRRPQFPVAGKDLIAAGTVEGAALGLLLKEMEARWIASNFTLSKAALFDLFKLSSPDA
ncbi:MAG: CCA tRNA nucleotidyltransferase [Alphaproteobacteria bacterium]|nr:MAG: CCA tRNA nucleotidyltransferase [Alphaproteobacteria bacterium]